MGFEEEGRLEKVMSRLRSSADSGIQDYHSDIFHYSVRNSYFSGSVQRGFPGNPYHRNRIADYLNSPSKSSYSPKKGDADYGFGEGSGSSRKIPLRIFSISDFL